MKRILLIGLTLVLLFTFAACGSEVGQVLEDPDITIEQIAWSVVEAEEANGDRYLLCEFTNNSAYTVTSLRLSFAGRDDLTDETLDSFFADIQVSQGFGDAFMADFRQQRKDKISMYAQADGVLSAGQTAESVKCYYFGGLTCKNVIYPELFAPEVAQFTYEKMGKTYSIDYEFATGAYKVAEVQGD